MRVVEASVWGRKLIMKVRKWIASGALAVAALGTGGGVWAANAGAATSSTTSSSSSAGVATLEGIICKIFPFLPFCHHHQSPPVSSPTK